MDHVKELRTSRAGTDEQEKAAMRPTLSATAVLQEPTINCPDTPAWNEHSLTKMQTEPQRIHLYSKRKVARKVLLIYVTSVSLKTPVKTIIQAQHSGLWVEGNLITYMKTSNDWNYLLNRLLVIVTDELQLPSSIYMLPCNMMGNISLY